MKYGGANEIPACKVECRADEFENSIREIGVEFACEWFGHDSSSEFVNDVVKILCDRSGIKDSR